MLSRWEEKRLENSEQRPELQTGVGELPVGGGGCILLKVCSVFLVKYDSERMQSPESRQRKKRGLMEGHAAAAKVS